MNVLASDMRHMTASWDGTSRQLWMRSIPRVLAQGRFRTVVYFRLSAALHGRGLRFLAMWLQSRGQRASGAEIHPAARIGPGLNLVHGSGVVIGHLVTAGPDLVLYQGVTLGHGRDDGGQPTLGSRVRVHAQASILGPVRVGDGAVIGAHALVLADVGPGQRVVGLWTSPKRPT